VNVDPEVFAKWCGAAAAFGAAFAGVKPFAEQWFRSWLARTEKREEARIERERAEREASNRVLVALEGSVRVQEHHVGVLERLSERLDNVDRRLDAIMDHEGISLPRPSPPPPPIPVRATLPGVGGVTSTGQWPALSGGSHDPAPGSGRTPGG